MLLLHHRDAVVETKGLSRALCRERTEGVAGVGAVAAAAASEAAQDRKAVKAEGLAGFDGDLGERVRRRDAQRPRRSEGGALKLGDDGEQTRIAHREERKHLGLAKEALLRRGRRLALDGRRRVPRELVRRMVRVIAEPRCGQVLHGSRGAPGATESPDNV